MSAFGTKKSGGDTAIELTFPAVFQSVYNSPLAYYHSGGDKHADVLVGDDFQSAYHEQKRQEAHRSVLNGLQARRTQERLLLTGHQNYHLPRPVLSQRRFANPMNGATSLYSARQDGSVDAPFRISDAGLTGGVLRSAEGQAYARAILDRRIAQLDKIDALARGMPVAMGSERPVANGNMVGDSAKIEFNLLRQTIIDALSTGSVGNFTFSDVVRLMLLLFRYGPEADVNELEDIVAGFDTIVESVQSLGETLDTPDMAIRSNVSPEYLESIEILMKKARQYSVEMNKGVNLQDKDRLALSKALVRSLGFSKLLRVPAKQLAKLVAQTNERVAQAVRTDEADDDEDMFDRPAAPREDEDQAGVARQPLAGRPTDGRDVFGARSGAYKPEGREQTAFFGEAHEADMPQMVMPVSGPLSTSEAQQGQAGDELSNAPQLIDDVEGAVRGIVMSMGFEGDDMTDPRVSQFLNEKYPDIDDFFHELESELDGMGYSSGQIAFALQALRQEAFKPYVAAHKSEIRQIIAPKASRAVNARELAAQQAMAGVGQASASSVPSRVAAIESKTQAAQLPAGFPKTRDEMDRRANSTADYIKWAESLRPILGSSFYNILSTTRQPNARSAFIYKIVQQRLAKVPGFESMRNF